MFTSSSGTAVFDGHCGFCTWCVEQLQKRSAAEVVAWQTLDAAQLRELGLREADVSERVYWLTPEGRVAGGGARAVAHALRTCGLPWSLAGRVILLPGVSSLAEIVYRFVARHRGRLPGVTPALDRD